ncbi:MAG: hypothetical protein ACYSR5_04960 [Planctomycetota bacterium]|jgi:hypothetical protein
MEKLIPLAFPSQHHRVEAQRGNKIPEGDAGAIIAAAQEIIDLFSAE